MTVEQLINILKMYPHGAKVTLMNIDREHDAVSIETYDCTTVAICPDYDEIKQAMNDTSFCNFWNDYIKNIINKCQYLLNCGMGKQKSLEHLIKILEEGKI